MNPQDIANNRSVLYRIRSFFSKKIVRYFIFCVALVFFIVLISYLSPVQLNSVKGEEKEKNKNDEAVVSPPKICNNPRCISVINAFQHAWNGYEKYAFGFDELLPVSHKGNNWLKEGSLGMQIIDSLDTAIIMGLDDVVEKSIKWIRKNLNLNRNGYVSVFETNIRILGGLITSFELTQESVLLEKAIEIADKLIPAFDTSTGVPQSKVNLVTGDTQKSDWANYAILAEFGSLQLEFRKLAQLSKNPIYDELVTKIMDIMIKDSSRFSHGQFPNYYNINSGEWVGDHYKWGSLSDSTYEYFIKQYLLTRKTEPKYRILYDRAIEGMQKMLVKKNLGLTYLIEQEYGRDIDKMEHLTCFVIGSLVIGAEGERAEKDIQLAKELAETCYQSYQKMPSKLGPDSYSFDKYHEFIVEDPKFRLRPETVEGLFYLYRYTGDKKYQDMGWTIFQTIEKNCKTDAGYSSVKDVREKPEKEGFLRDRMRTFFMAETLKYLYLLFAPVDIIPLDEYVFNTESHPLKMFDR